MQVVPAGVAQDPRQVRHLHAVRLGRWQLVIGMSEQHIPRPAFQKADAVLYLNGGAVFDDLFLVLQHRTPSAWAFPAANVAE
jgi:hypothetical protein